MALSIALNFEDGVTRFVEAKPGDTVPEASYRLGINIPLDCRDGACGTCKCRVQSGTFTPGDYIEDAFTDGTIWARPFAEYEEAQIEAEIRRSLFPTLWCCRAVLPALIKGGGGAIVNVSSIATRGINRVPYSAAKGGVNAMTASLAWEYAGHNIRVNAVAPGGTEAPPRRIPRNAQGSREQSAQEEGWWREVVEQTKASSVMHRYGITEEQAAAILFLASDEASYITGVTLPVGGGDLG